MHAQKAAARSRAVKWSVGAAVTSAFFSVAVLHGVASAAETQPTPVPTPTPTSSPAPTSTSSPTSTCGPHDVCVWSQDGKQQLTFHDPAGQMIDLFRYSRGPGPAGTWANGVGRLSNHTRVSVLLQDIDTGHPVIVGTVAPGQDASVPEVRLDLADRLLLIE
jgi:hypothetical protein